MVDRIRRATNPGGVTALGFVTDRVEVLRDGTSRPALVESAMSAADAASMLLDSFRGFDIASLESGRTEVPEQRGDEHYTLVSTLVTFLATRPGP